MGAHLSRTVGEGRAFMQIIGRQGGRFAVRASASTSSARPTGMVFASIPASGKADVDRAVRAARTRLR